MLVARVTLTGSRFLLLLSLLFARAYLSDPVCLAGRRRSRRTKKRLLCWIEKENKSSPSLPHILTPTTPPHHFSPLLPLLSLRVVDERTSWLYNIYINVYMPVCHYLLNPYWWLCLQCRLHTFLTGVRQKNASKRMNE